ncbi:MAG: phosphotransferase family protein [Bacillota bacterium]
MDRGQMVAIIGAALEGVEVRRATFDEGGQNNIIVMVNDEWVFRFPKYREAVLEARREYEVLDRIADRFELPVPVARYRSLDSDQVGQVFVGYRLIPGRPLTRELLQACREPHVIAAQLGGFLHQLHSVRRIELQGLGLTDCDTYERWSMLHQRIVARLYPHMSDAMRQEVERSFECFLAVVSHNAVPVRLIHGDLGPGNILYDQDRNRVTGIIDFSSISWGDPATDIAALALGPFGLGMDFLEDLLTAYPMGKSDLVRARFYASTFPLQYALFGIEQNDPNAVRDGLANYRAP